MDSTSQLLASLVMLRVLKDNAAVLDFARTVISKISGVKSVSALAAEDDVALPPGHRSILTGGSELTFPISFLNTKFAHLNVAFDEPPAEMMVSDIMNFANQVALELVRRDNEAELRYLLNERDSENSKLNAVSRMAVNSSGIGVWEFNLETGHLFWNERMFDIFGSDPETFSADVSDWSDRVHPDDIEHASAELQKTMETGQPLSMSFRIVRPQGDVRHIKAAAEVITDERTHDRLLIGTNIDDTQQIETTEHLSAALRDAEAANISKSMFLASVSHELRTPLNAIIGISESLMEGYFGQMSEKHSEYVTDVYSSGMHLLSLVDDLLTLTQLDLGKKLVDLQPVLLRELVGDCAKLLDAASIAPRRPISVDIDDAANCAYADPRAMKQIVLNLLTNARKYGGPSVDISVSATILPGMMEIAVHDNGPGMDSKFTKHAVEAFTQEKFQSYVAQDGWGLGLTIVKSLAEAHGGNLVIDTKKGFGTTVKVQLPLEPSKPQPGQEQQREVPKYETPNSDAKKKDNHDIERPLLEPSS